jgi:GH24 family phage-related lysozyme (muramidase)
MNTKDVEDFELMKVLEGYKTKAYKCPAGYTTISVGFNMERAGARQVWDELIGMEVDFDEAFAGNVELNELQALKLFKHDWDNCESAVRRRCMELKLNYDAFPDYKKFTLKDIVYNVGSIRKWYKVLVNTDPRKVMYEARRNPKELMDSRVCKICYQFGICKDLEDCKKLGLEYAKYVS